MDDRICAMENIFSPKSVAFVGASNNIGKWGGIIFMNMVMGGYEGKIYPVNAREEQIQGRKAYKSISEIPDEIDLAIYTIPAAGLPDAITESVKKGVRAGIVITAGFGELGEEGKSLQDEIIRRARAGGMVIVGPNGQGISSPLHKFHPWMPLFNPDPGVIGIASQSGNVSTVLSETLSEFGFGCSKVISAGNCADLSWPDYLEYFRRDPETKVILLYIEGVQDGRAFFDAAKKTSLEKPVIVLKSGRTPAGSSAAASHTGVLAGTDSIFDALCRQAGIIRVGTIDDAVHVAAAFVTTPLPRGRRVGIVTGGGGYGVIAADAAYSLGLDLVKFSDKTVAELKKQLAPWWSPNNPVDMVAGLSYGGPKEIVPILMDSGEIDGVILLGIGWFYHMVDAVNTKHDFLNFNNKHMQFRHDQEIEYASVLAQYTQKWGMPFLMTSQSARLAIRRKYTSLVNMLKEGIMLYPSIEDSIKAFAFLSDRYRFLHREGVL